MPQFERTADEREQNLKPKDEPQMNADLRRYMLWLCSPQGSLAVLGGGRCTVTAFADAKEMRASKNL
jgi:hypothetical protein